MCALNDSLTEIDWLNTLTIRPPFEQKEDQNNSISKTNDRQNKLKSVCHEKTNEEMHSFKMCCGFEKPSFSYAYLIKLAIESTPEKKLRLNEIYGWIIEKFPYYRHIKSDNNKGWKNAIRHNLSLNKIFKRCPKESSHLGKGSYWCLDSSCDDGVLQYPPVKKAKLSPVTPQSQLEEPTDCSNTSTPKDNKPTINSSNVSIEYNPTANDINMQSSQYIPPAVPTVKPYTVFLSNMNPLVAVTVSQLQHQQQQAQPQLQQLEHQPKLSHSAFMPYSTSTASSGNGSASTGTTMADCCWAPSSAELLPPSNSSSILTPVSLPASLTPPQAQPPPRCLPPQPTQMLNNLGNGFIDHGHLCEYSYLEVDDSQPEIVAGNSGDSIRNSLLLKTPVLSQITVPGEDEDEELDELEEARDAYEDEQQLESGQSSNCSPVREKQTQQQQPQQLPSNSPENNVLTTHFQDSFNFQDSTFMSLHQSFFDSQSYMRGSVQRRVNEEPEKSPEDLSMSSKSSLSPDFAPLSQPPNPATATPPIDLTNSSDAIFEASLGLSQDTKAYLLTFSDHAQLSRSHWAELTLTCQIHKQQQQQKTQQQSLSPDSGSIESGLLPLQQLSPSCSRSSLLLANAVRAARPTGFQKFAKKKMKKKIEWADDSASDWSNRDFEEMKKSLRQYRYKTVVHNNHSDLYKVTQPRRPVVNGINDIRPRFLSPVETESGSQSTPSTEKSSDTMKEVFFGAASGAAMTDDSLCNDLNLLLKSASGGRLSSNSGSDTSSGEKKKKKTEEDAEIVDDFNWETIV